MLRPAELDRQIDKAKEIGWDKWFDWNEKRISAIDQERNADRVELRRYQRALFWLMYGTAFVSVIFGIISAVFLVMGNTRPGILSAATALGGALVAGLFRFLQRSIERAQANNDRKGAELERCAQMMHAIRVTPDLARQSEQIDQLVSALAEVLGKEEPERPRRAIELIMDELPWRRRHTDS